MKDGFDCEDNPPSCYSGFELEGFGEDYDGYYSSKDNASGIEYFEDSKQVKWKNSFEKKINSFHSGKNSKDYEKPE